MQSDNKMFENLTVNDKKNACTIFKAIDLLNPFELLSNFPISEFPIPETLQSDLVLLSVLCFNILLNYLLPIFSL